IIARNSQRTVAVPDIHQLANSLLRLPRLSREIVQIRNMEAGLIALRIQPNQTGGVRKLAEELILRGPILLHKQVVQPLIEGIAAAEQTDQAGDVILDAERVNP